VEDYDNESVFLGEVARIHGRVEVKLKVGMWNPVVGEMWMQDYLTAGVSGATAGTTVDTNQVGRYVVTGTVHPFGKTTNLKAIVSGVYLENFGVIGQQDTWNPMEVSGIGTSVVFSNPA
jgi:hypothetical protein